jgi:hypothetical protein
MLAIGFRSWSSASYSVGGRVMIQLSLVEKNASKSCSTYSLGLPEAQKCRQGEGIQI